MRRLLLLLLIPALTAVGLALVQDSPPEGALADTATPEHLWLKHLVGDWDVTTTMTMAPGAEPMSMQSVERTRAIGDLWIQGELNADVFGTPMTALITLGYDPAKKVFVGTWLDSMHSHLWHYTGRLDEGRKVLTLEAEGPNMAGDGSLALFRDAFEIVSPDKKILRASIQNADGTWTEFMQAEYVRQKRAQ
jgi:hypothetical protein